ncbi:uncharacterized protein LOC101854274 [Aplysia californica]|uniref:Uncharacterized protein LOC101854274 n=1 Tax=Aplysia californica TaxID=6500 RepID=A0ABM1VZ26_APLCA|nr:uncharacterized protein LOC101854274 [Aplysia californica]
MLRSPACSDAGFGEEEDEDILLQAEELSALCYKDKEYTEIVEGIDFDEEMNEEDAANISLGLNGNEGVSAAMSSDDVCPEFDMEAGSLWIYPTNYPVRDYQFNIIQKALYKNTLVVLPTGLGKTFIAAVLMYNMYRWFPQSKVIFMAPTKPLVAQQVNACYNIMGIPKEDTIEMTGTMSPVLRQRAWREKRVIFLTPQVLTNDLSSRSCDAHTVKCLVVDEAHKATGNHAYCQVVRELVKETNKFRILALSATPGSDLKAVQQMMNNLLISHIELRSEDSFDIKPYTHERKIEKVVVPLGQELSAIRLQYIQVMTMVVKRLIQIRVIYNREATKLSKFLILKARDEFRQNPPGRLSKTQAGNIEADFALAISLYHGFDLLQQHGLRSLYNYLLSVISGKKGYGKTRTELQRNADFNAIMEQLRDKFAAPGPGTSAGDAKMVVGHPKMQRLEEVVLDHFKTFHKRGLETRVMIFSQFRDSVQEIADILGQHAPLVKVMPFIGQASAGKATKGYTQKEQLESYNQSLYSKKSIHKAILNGARSLHFYPDNHRLVPAAFLPKCHKMFITVTPSSSGSGQKVKAGQSKSASKQGQNHRKISDVFKKRGRPPASDDGPTVEEWEDIREEFLAGMETAKCLPRSKCVSLGKGSQTTVSGRVQDPEQLDLAEWMAWQNRQQKAHITGHSCASLHLVQDAEFIELQKVLVDEDPYGPEMRQYLNSSDIYLHGEVDGNTSIDGQGSIRSFLAPSTSKSGPVTEIDEDDSPKGSSTEATEGRREFVKERASSLFTECGTGENSEQSCQGTSSSGVLGKGQKVKSKTRGKNIYGTKAVMKVGKGRKGKGKQTKGATYVDGSEELQCVKKKKSSLFQMLESIAPSPGGRQDCDDFEENDVVEVFGDEDDKDKTSHHRKDVSEKEQSLTVGTLNVNDAEAEGADVVLCSPPAVPQKAEKTSSSWETNLSSQMGRCTVLNKDRQKCDIFVPCVPSPPDLDEVQELKELLLDVKSGSDFRNVDLEKMMSEWEVTEGMNCENKERQRLFSSLGKLDCREEEEIPKCSRGDLNISYEAEMLKSVSSFRKKLPVSDLTSAASTFIDSEREIMSLRGKPCDRDGEICMESGDEGSECELSSPSSAAPTSILPVKSVHSGIKKPKVMNENKRKSVTFCEETSVIPISAAEDILKKDSEKFNVETKPACGAVSSELDDDMFEDMSELFHLNFDELDEPLPGTEDENLDELDNVTGAKKGEVNFPELGGLDPKLNKENFGEFDDTDPEVVEDNCDEVEESNFILEEENVDRFDDTDPEVVEENCDEVEESNFKLVEENFDGLDEPMMEEERREDFQSHTSGARRGKLAGLSLRQVVSEPAVQPLETKEGLNVSGCQNADRSHNHSQSFFTFSQALSVLNVSSSEDNPASHSPPLSSAESQAGKVTPSVSPAVGSRALKSQSRYRNDRVSQLLSPSARLLNEDRLSHLQSPNARQTNNARSSCLQSPSGSLFNHDQLSRLQSPRGRLSNHDQLSHPQSPSSRLTKKDRRSHQLSPNARPSDNDRPTYLQSPSTGRSSGERLSHLHVGSPSPESAPEGLEFPNQKGNRLKDVEDVTALSEEDSDSLPHFDLGFDLDDEVIPPTPEKMSSSSLMKSASASYKAKRSFDLSKEVNQSDLALCALSENTSCKQSPVAISGCDPHSSTSDIFDLPRSNSEASSSIKRARTSSVAINDREVGSQKLTSNVETFSLRIATKVSVSINDTKQEKKSYASKFDFSSSFELPTDIPEEWDWEVSSKAKDEKDKENQPFSDSCSSFDFQDEVKEPLQDVNSKTKDHANEHQAASSMSAEKTSEKEFLGSKSCVQETSLSPCLKSPLNKQSDTDKLMPLFSQSAVPKRGGRPSLLDVTVISDEDSLDSFQVMAVPLSKDQPRKLTSSQGLDDSPGWLRKSTKLSLAAEKSCKQSSFQNGDQETKLRQTKLRLGKRKDKSFEESSQHRRKLFARGHDEVSTGESRLNDLSVQAWQSESPEVSNSRQGLSQNTKGSSQNTKTSSQNTKNSFKNADNSRTFGSKSGIESREMEEVCAAEVRRVHGVGSSTPLRHTSVSASSAHLQLTPIKLVPSEDDEADEESMLMPLRRRMRAAVLDFSSDSDVNIHVSPHTSLKGEAVTGSCDKTTLSLKQTHSAVSGKKSSFVLSDIEEDDDDDFEEPYASVNTSKNSSHSKSKAPLRSRQEDCRAKKKKTAKHGFVDVEAQVSGSEASSDEPEDQEDDHYDFSFIDNNTLMTQAQGTDMRAVYLKSVKSPPAGQAGAFKLQYGWKERDDDRDMIFSQAVPEDYGLSEYEEDSFCVASDAGESASLSSPARPKGKRRQKKKDNQRAGKCKKIEGKRRIRMIHSSSSESENEDDRLPMTQEFSARPTKRGKFLNSSTEDNQDEEDFESSDLRKVGLNPGAGASSLDGRTCLSSPKVRSESDGFTQLKGGKMAEVEVAAPEKENRMGTLEDFELFDENTWLDDMEFTDEPRLMGASAGRHGAVSPASDSVQNSKTSVQNSRTSVQNSKTSSKISITLEGNPKTLVSEISTTVVSNFRIVEENSESVSCSVSGSSGAEPFLSLSRDERLRRQKQKQAMFRQKLGARERTDGSIGGKARATNSHVQDGRRGGEPEMEISSAQNLGGNAHSGDMARRVTRLRTAKQHTAK